VAIETKEKKIGDAVYMVTQLPARRALRLKAKLIKLFGAAFTQFVLMANDPAEKDVKDMTAEEIAELSAAGLVDQYRLRDLKRASAVKVVQLLAQTIDDKTFDDLCVEILQGVRRDGVELLPSAIDLAFAGCLMELYTVILFVLEVNFSDFFFAMRSTGSPLTEELLQEDTKKTYTFRSEKNSSSGA
jgi:hypothetical protein